MSQDDDHEQALEFAAATVHIDHTIEVRRARDFARTAITAYLSAMPPRLSPDLIAKLTALASRLTAQGEYDAVDLIDTVVARVSAMPSRELLREALEALTRIGALPRYTDGDNEAQDIARAALSALPERELRYMDEGEQAIMGAALRKSAKVVSRHEPGRELLAEALSALTEIARDEIGGLQAIYEAHEFDPGDYDKDTCVARLRSWMEDEATYLMGRIRYRRDRARAAADKIRAVMGGEK